MNRSVVVVAILTLLFIAMPQSCKKDPNGGIDVAGIETGVYNKIKAFRESNGVTGAFNQSYLFNTEVESISYEMRSSGAILGTERVNTYIVDLRDKVGSFNEQILMQITPDDTYETIAANWTADESLKEILLGEYTQCAVGIEFDDDGMSYVAMILCAIP